MLALQVNWYDVGANTVNDCATSAKVLVNTTTCL